MSNELAVRCAELAHEYRPLLVELLREAVRIPADHVDTVPNCGMSNHEGPRLEYLKRRIVEIGAVEKPEDVWFDDFGNIIWMVEDTEDTTENKKVVWYDGHTDTVAHLRESWLEKTNGGIDCFDGLLDKSKVDMEFIKELGYCPPHELWEEEVLFGRGVADQLQGVICQIVSTKIMLETKHLGSLRGVIVQSIGTVAEEDNDGGGPMYILRKDMKKPDTRMRIPDVCVFTEGTGHADHGALGIYRGQRGRMQIEVEIIGQSCHGSMPHRGKNPLEWGAKIIAEAADRHEKGIDILDHEFLGKGTRTASWSVIDTPSDCAVPDSFKFRFDRRMTVGETPEFCIEAIESLDTIKACREAGLEVTISVPRYTEKSWRGVNADNDQIYLGWQTPEDHPAITSAMETYKVAITPYIPEGLCQDESKSPIHIPREPRVDKWTFSTDGVGFPLRTDEITIPDSKKWIEVGPFSHCAMLGLGGGFEESAHVIGEAVMIPEIVLTASFYASYPAFFAKAE
ncbi:hypothetical protein PCE1_004064 [Barthelona sp. PCE]